MAVPYMSIHNCRVSYGKTPVITAMSESATIGNVNCHVDDINLQAQTAVIRFSAKFTGYVHVTAIVRA